MTDAPVLCAGAAQWDMLARAADPLSPGADVPGRIHPRPGGVALNIAVELAALGTPSVLLARTGDDAEGAALIRATAARGVDTRMVERDTHPTDRYLGIEAPDGSLFAAVADCSGLERASPPGLGFLMQGAEGARTLLADTNLSAAALESLLREAAHRGMDLSIVCASPAKAPRAGPALARTAATLYLNRAEAEAILGHPCRSAEEAASALAPAIAARAVVTDGAAGAAMAGADGVIALPAPAVATVSVTGAGDSFAAAHVHARRRGMAAEAALAEALQLAAARVAAPAPRPAAPAGAPDA